MAAPSPSGRNIVASQARSATNSELLSARDASTTKQSRNTKHLRLPECRSPGHFALLTPVAATALSWRFDGHGCLVQAEKTSLPGTPYPWETSHVPSSPGTGFAMPLLPDLDSDEIKESLPDEENVRRLPISKADISSPTLLSSSFSRSLVDLPSGASLKNGMEPYQSLGCRQTAEGTFQRSPAFKRQESWPLSSNRVNTPPSQGLAHNLQEKSRFVGLGKLFKWAPKSTVPEMQRTDHGTLAPDNTDTSMLGQTKYTLKNSDTSSSDGRSVLHLWKGVRCRRRVRKPKTYIDDIRERRHSPVPA
ncbi:Hypothetical predicted protein [Lecanosticta acicola]|uniref:Uncharacterized protein n=1 Tax=Lecanosticta acicola TaxID=111012 RepID=A0AAI8YXE5_9PEZI|nr:Hypothetical predicted protein [Lecanosticta acicola]